jgi:hypothetical protein
MKYSVEVTITAQCTYTVEVEADGDYKAELEAGSRWRDMLPDDFQVDRGYLTDEECEVTQLSWECDECADDCSEAEYSRTGGLCDACDRKFNAEYVDTREIA